MDLELEEELVKRAQNDLEAFGELYDQYYPKIFGYILKRTASIAIAQDITSEVFFKVLKNLRQFRWRGIPFSSWLYRIATNEIANYSRKENPKTVSLELIAEPATTDNPLTEVLEAERELEKHEDFLLLHEKISELPPKYQEVIVLRFFEKKKIKEVAQILGKREGVIKSLLHRGLGRLRILMEKNATF